jgi:hypothetical protein
MTVNLAISNRVGKMQILVIFGDFYEVQASNSVCLRSQNSATAISILCEAEGFLLLVRFARPACAISRSPIVPARAPISSLLYARFPAPCAS